MEPLVTPALIRKLEEVFPLEISRQWDERELHIRVGHKEVLDYIRQLHDERATGEGE